MSDLFARGYIVEIILGLMGVEFLALSFFRNRTGGGVPTQGLIINLLAGAALLLALRAALMNESWQTVSLWLLLALAAHVLDLTYRWSTDA